MRRRTNPLPLLAVVPVLLVGPALAQDEEEGLLAFNNHCRQCHVTNEGDHRLGPSLHGIVGREAGTQEGFGYSPAMQRSAVVWDEDTLARFMEDPDSVVPGNNMRPFAGVASAEERARIAAYLASEGES